jgi:RNA polymerase sigma-70 factor (ECF subfamily)
MKKTSSKSDKKLVKLSLNDDKYFVELVERYEPKLGRYIFRLSRVDEQTIEDLLQEVFIKVYRNLNDYDDDFSFSSWIYRITHNEVMSFFRKNKARPKVVNFEIDDSSEYIAMLPDDVDLPQELARKELSAKVRESIYELPEKYREVLVLRYLEDKSYNEISDILRKSMGAISVLMNRAKKRLKKNLSPKL